MDKQASVIDLNNARSLCFNSLYLDISEIFPDRTLYVSSRETKSLVFKNYISYLNKKNLKKYVLYHDYLKFKNDVYLLVQKGIYPIIFLDAADKKDFRWDGGMYFLLELSCLIVKNGKVTEIDRVMLRDTVREYYSVVGSSASREEVSLCHMGSAANRGSFVKQVICRPCSSNATFFYCIFKDKLFRDSCAQICDFEMLNVKSGALELTEGESLYYLMFSQNKNMEQKIRANYLFVFYRLDDRERDYIISWPFMIDKQRVCFDSIYFQQGICDRSAGSLSQFMTGLCVMWYELYYYLVFRWQGSLREN